LGKISYKQESAEKKPAATALDKPIIQEFLELLLVLVLLSTE